MFEWWIKISHMNPKHRTAYNVEVKARKKPKVFWQRHDGNGLRSLHATKSVWAPLVTR